MKPPDDIINDVSVFVSLWKDVMRKIKEDSEVLMKEYGVTNEEYDYDDGSYFFLQLRMSDINGTGTKKSCMI